MKWGVRRTPEQLGHRIKKAFSPKKKVETKPVSQPQSQQKRRSVKDMSDEELRKIINRIELERKYSQLTTQQTSKGKKFVTDVLYKSAKTTATTYTTKAMMKAVERLLNNRPSGSGGSS